MWIAGPAQSIAEKVALARTSIHVRDFLLKYSGTFGVSKQRAGRQVHCGAHAAWPKKLVGIPVRIISAEILEHVRARRASSSSLLKPGAKLTSVLGKRCVRPAFSIVPPSAEKQIPCLQWRKGVLLAQQTEVGSQLVKGSAYQLWARKAGASSQALLAS